MFGLLNFLGNVIVDVVHSNNQRDVDIITDNNRTRVEISKIVLGGVTLIGTLALQFYCNRQNKPETPAIEPHQPDFAKEHESDLSDI